MPESLSAGTVSLGVKPDTKGFGAKLAEGIRGESGGVTGLGSELGGKLLAGLGAIGIAIGVGEFIKKGIEEYSTADALNAQFAAGITSTNNAAGLTVKGMDELAASIAGYSGQSYASIGKTEQVLQTFTNLRNVGPNKIFDEATTAAANMAAKLGGDASASAIQLGKALNDPVKGMTALRRVGVAFTQAQTDQVKAMVKSGDVMGAQKVILGELNTEFGGAAKAAGQTLPGEIARSNVAFGELTKAVVGGVMPFVTPAIAGIANAVSQATPWVEKMGEAFKEKVGEAIKTLHPVFIAVSGAFTTFGGFLANTIVPALIQFGHWIQDNAKWLGLIASMVLGAVVAFKAYEMIIGAVKLATAAWAVVQGALDLVMNANPISIIILAIGALVAAVIWVATQTHFFQDAWKVMTDAVGGAWNWLWTTIIKPVVDFIVGYFHVLGEVVMWIWTSVFKPVGDFIGNAVDLIGSVIGRVFGTIGSIIRGAFNGVVDFVKGIFNTIINVVNGIIRGINGATSMAGAIGIHIGAIPQLPHLADSGTVLPTPGGTIVRVAEGGKAESVVDTGKLNSLMDAASSNAKRGGDTFNIYETVSAQATAAQVARRQVAFAV